jgi:hypothetical protein
VVSVVRVPDPVPVDFLKSAIPFKPVASIAPAPVAPAVSTVPVTVAAGSTSPRRATGRVPAVARSPRPKRTEAELLAEARTTTAGWPLSELTAEGIRRAVRTSPANARMLRETLRAERAGAAA